MDSSIAVIDNNLDSSRDTTKYFLNNTAKASPLISIAAVIIGLFAQHVIWSGWLVRNNLLGSPQTIIGLTVVHRVLPIALVIGCMMVTMKAVRYIIAITPSLVRSCNKLWWWCQSTMRGTLYMQLGNYDSGDGDGDCEVARSEIIPLSVIEEHKHCSHHVQIGRPDFNALVHEAAAPLQTREGIRAQLVVAACGPTTLVVRQLGPSPCQSINRFSSPAIQKTSSCLTSMSPWNHSRRCITLIKMINQRGQFLQNYRLAWCSQTEPSAVLASSHKT